MTLSIPPTRNHKQLAAWINTQQFVDDKKRPVRATVESRRVSTDRKAGRLRVPGKGRQGLLLKIVLIDTPAPTGDWWYDRRRGILFEHNSGETYRRHDEAREWVAKNLQRKGR